MKNLITLLCLMAISACLFAQTGSFTYDGANRSYILYIPSSYNPAQPAPLVINMHGLTSNASQQQFFSDFDVVADTAGCIVVYPNGLNNSWNVGFSGNYTGGVDDVGFISALIDTLAKNYNIDLSRVYATGMSNGGFMSFRLACELHERIAAIASVTGSMTDSMAYFCQTVRPVPVMHIHGTADLVVSYNGAAFSVPVEDNIQFWVQKNNCSAAPVVYDFPNTSLTDMSTVTSYYYGLCDAGTEVVLFKVTNGGHTWPGGMPIPFVGNTNMDIHGSDEIWKFFLRHQHPAPLVSSVNEKVESFSEVAVYPNPASDILHLRTSLKEIRQVEIFDLMGKRVMATTPDNMDLSSGSLQLSVDFLEKGIYFLKVTAGEEMTAAKFVKE